MDAVIAPIRKAVADALPGSTWLKLTTGRDLVARDPLTYATVAAAMLICAALAALGAAWRLRRLVPIEALRIE